LRRSGRRCASQARYLESDAPSPSDEDGLIVAEVERGVLEILPQECSWGRARDSRHQTTTIFPGRLAVHLDGGEPFDAANDVVVSPTYAPDWHMPR
jgi:hypothetical protein